MIKIDKLAKELYKKRNFSACNEEQQQVIIKNILDKVTIKHMSNG